MKRTSKAKSAELIFLAAALAKDWQIATSVSGQAAWDALICVEGIWRTVQVKCAYRRGTRNRPYVDPMKGGGYGPKRTTQSRKYRAGDFDFLAAVDVGTREVWLIPALQAIGRRSLVLRDEWMMQ